MAPEWVWPLPPVRGKLPTVTAELVGAKRRNVELGYRDAPADLIPVRAARAGRVVTSIQLPTGSAVIVDHEDGWSTHYAHLSTSFVEPCIPDGSRKKRVTAGEAIGLASRLCFEMWRWNGHAFHCVDAKLHLPSFIEEPTRTS